MFVERQVRDQSFEPAILVLERSQPTQLADAEMRVLLLPDVEGRFADANLPADIGRGRTSLDLAQGVRDLLFGELRLLHRSHPLIEGPRTRRVSLL